MSQKVNVAAVQFNWKLEDYRNKTSLQGRVNSIMEDIRSRTDDSLPLLVVFPEYIGTPILLFNSYSMVKDMESFSQAVQGLIMANLPGVLRYKLRYGVSFIRALMLSKSIAMEKDYVSIFSHAAKEYKAYIASGSITLPDIKHDNGKKLIQGRNVYNVSYFFGPDGHIIGKQKKVHFVDFEGKSGFDLSKGKLEDLKIFETPFGKVGIAICLDAFKNDVCTALSEGGTDILLQPTANNGEWSEWQQKDWLNGSYLAAHGRKLFKYAVNPMMSGKILDLGFQGQSSIISSIDTGMKINYSLLSPIDGFVSLANGHDTEEILLSTVEI